MRRWESGQLCPTDEDLIHFGKVFQLSQHQIDFLRTAFTNIKAPLPLDTNSFRTNTIRRLTSRRAPMILFDELMYARAWNGYVSVLGEHALTMLRSDRHPIEGFLDGLGPCDLEPKESLDRARKAVRSFWRFTAFYCGEAVYRELLGRLGEKPVFREIWSDLAVTADSSEIDISGVAGLLLPEKPRFEMLHSLVVYPPVYTLIEFEPEDEQALATLDLARRKFEPTVEFSSRFHWAQPSLEHLPEDLVLTPPEIMTAPRSAASAS